MELSKDDGRSAGNAKWNGYWCIPAGNTLPEKRGINRIKKKSSTYLQITSKHFN